LKCDEKEKARDVAFKPESPFVIICEGFQDAGFVCALLKNLKIDNCDVTYPKKRRDGANGQSGIAAMLGLLAVEPLVKGIALLWDADTDAEESFKEACAAFISPFHPPKQSFSIEEHKDRKTGIFLIPGEGKTGTLEHLLLKAVKESHADLISCIDAFNSNYPRGERWAENKKVKRDMHCVVAAFCEDDPGCSIGFIWQKRKDNPIDLSSAHFDELKSFLRSFAEKPADTPESFVTKDSLLPQ
jgi:hypothetical protein